MSTRLVAAALIAGVATTMLIAGVCAALVPARSIWVFGTTDTDHEWLSNAGWRSSGPTLVKRRSWRGVGVTVIDLVPAASFGDSIGDVPRGGGCGQRVLAGWPLRCFSGGWTTRPDCDRAIATAIPLPVGPPRAGLIPLQPLWWPLFINVAVVALVVWLALRVSAKRRRAAALRAP